jgi:hypothetical protein
MNRYTRANLLDAIRRQEIEGGPSRKRMTVLTTPSLAKQGVDAGMFVLSYGTRPTPRVLNWYDLTDAGLQETDRLRTENSIIAGEPGNTERLWVLI